MSLVRVRIVVGDGHDLSQKLLGALQLSDIFESFGERIPEREIVRFDCLSSEHGLEALDGHRAPAATDECPGEDHNGFVVARVFFRYLLEILEHLAFSICFGGRLRRFVEAFDCAKRGAALSKMPRSR